MTAEDKERLRQKQEMSGKAKKMFSDMVFQGVFLALLMGLMLGSQDANVYRQNANIKNVFNYKIEKVMLSKCISLLCLIP